MRHYAAATATGVVLLCILSQASLLAIEDPSYALSPWPYGAIAWVGGLPADYQTISTTLTQAVEDVFAFWELPSPDPMLGWEDPASNEPAWKTGHQGSIPQVIKKDPSTSQLWRLNPLEWEDTETYAVLYIAFPNRILLAQAFGSISIGGRLNFGGGASLGSARWYLSIAGVPISITAPAYDALRTAWHELAHWMTSLVCHRDQIVANHLPLLIEEGIANYTQSSLVGVPGSDPYVTTWANTLTVEMDRFDVYLVGTSLVTYLVENQGATVFLKSLSLWAEDPESML
ncbi:hypothetical protein IH601_04275, partial [Candidatus Bipolaricaulota bacterium]|nr:hypothetical protein [Candidatus Bipolaricaulota bacterium]